MRNRQFKVKEQQDRQLQRAFLETKDGATRTRYQAVRLYGQGYSVKEIVRITGCNRTSLLEWCGKYREQGLEGLKDHRGGPHRAKLGEDTVKEIADKLHQYRPRDLFGSETYTSSGQHWTVEDLVRAVEKWTGVTWKSRGSYRTLLAHCGFTYQRTERVYKSRREREVMDFEDLVEKN